MTELPAVWRLFEFLEGHHDCQQLICAVLDHLAGEPGAVDARETALLMLDYFKREMPFHIADEEDDLFTLMVQRCHEDDGFEETVAMLESEHESDHELYDHLVLALGVLSSGAMVENHVVFARDAVSFSTLQR